MLVLPSYRGQWGEIHEQKMDVYDCVILLTLHLI
jgi:hypothetical protein